MRERSSVDVSSVKAEGEEEREEEEAAADRCVTVELRRVRAAGQASSKEGCLSAPDFGRRSLLISASSTFSFCPWVHCVLQ